MAILTSIAGFWLVVERRMTLGVRHDVSAEFRAEPSPSPFARSGDGDAETESVAEEAAMDGAETTATTPQLHEAFLALPPTDM